MTYETFKERVQEFLKYLEFERNVSSNTLKAYLGDLQGFLYFWNDLSDLEKKTLAINTVVERYLVSLFYKKISKSSIARKFSCFSSLERFLKKKSLSLNLKITRPKIEKKLPIYLSVDEIFYLLDKVPDNDLPTKTPLRDRAIFEFMYATGVRCAELTALTVENINLVEKTARITGKGNKERIVLFGEKAKERLQTYFKKERIPVRSKSEPLFMATHGQTLSTRSVQRIYAMFRKFLPIDRPVTPHKIRHSFATHLLSQGADLRVVQELLGHKSLSSTELYTHVTLVDLAKTCTTKHPMNKRSAKTHTEE